GGVDKLVLLNAGAATERLTDDRSGIVVAIPRQVLDLYEGVRKGRANHCLDFVGCHCHRSNPRVHDRYGHVMLRSQTSIHAGKNRSWAARSTFRSTPDPSSSAS